MSFLPNPSLNRLGFANDDRVVIIHTDDIGMCQASVSAFAELWDFGLVSSGAVMVPCAWFPHAAAYWREHPGVDMGIHITLTSEWDAYRWGPISSRDPATGMLDAEGFFPRSNAPVQANGDPIAVQREMQAQVERAIAAGMTPTHIDTHMGTIMHPRFMLAYMQLSLQYRVPVFVPRMNEEQLRAHGLDAESATAILHSLQVLEANGIPFLDHISGMPLDVAGEHADHVEVAKHTFAALPAGITHFILHPSHDTPELRAIAPDWRARVANLQAFLSEELRNYLKHIGVQVIGYRALKALMYNTPNN
ncbi:MAG: polysaccharide deacetylase family protein [Chloroflexi bacterium]|nr:polysaccharide deacetylase family protein [Chloroflexota bacterium]